MADVDISLNFSMEHQRMGNWCWAATGKSTAVFYDRETELTQCSIANLVCDDPSCCDRPSGCNKAKKLSDTLKKTGNYVNHLEATIRWEEIRVEIEAGRVVCARIRWQGGGGHFVAVYGVAQTESTQWLYIDDPLLGSSYITYEEFLVNYHSSGTWTHSYYTDVKNRPSPN